MTLLTMATLASQVSTAVDRRFEQERFTAEPNWWDADEG